jgi:uncharacterized protein YkwD
VRQSTLAVLLAWAWILAAVSCGIRAQQATPPEASGPPDIAETVKRIVDGTNALRKEEGLRPLAIEPRLTTAAREFATFMSRTGRLDHMADRTTPAERAGKQGYEYCMVAENIAYQFRSSGFTAAALAREFLQEWRASPGHRQNMIDPNVTQIGVGVARNVQTGRYYAVQLFGRPRADAISFEIANASDETLQYDLDQQSFPLPPRYRRTHEQCGPLQLVFKWPGGQETTAVRPTGGGRYTVVKESSGRFTLRHD